MVVFIDISVFHFYILMSFDPHKYSLVWHSLKHGVAHNPMLHSHTWFFWRGGGAQLTWHQILIYGINHCLLCLVSSLFSWLIKGACFSCLVVTTPSGEGSLLVWGGFVCHNPLRPPANLYCYSRLKVCIVSPVFEVFVSKIICVIVSVIVTQSRMSYSSSECAS
jgi:hypothetical protein